MFAVILSNQCRNCGVSIFSSYGVADLQVERETITRMTALRDEGVAAFIGPDYPCKNEALVAGAWNLPMIAFVSRLFKNITINSRQLLFVNIVIVDKIF